MKFAYKSTHKSVDNMVEPEKEPWIDNQLILDRGTKFMLERTATSITPLRKLDIHPCQILKLEP